MTGISLTTPEQINLFRLITLIQCLSLHIKTDGKMRMTRVATPTRMRELASQYTGKGYKRGMDGLKDALADLERIKASLR